MFYFETRLIKLLFHVKPHAPPKGSLIKVTIIKSCCCCQRNCPSGNIQRPLWWDASWRCLVFFTFIFRTKGRHTFHITWWTHGMQIKIFIFDVHILRKSYIYIWFVIFVLQIGLGALIGFVAALCVFWIHKGLNKISFFLL